jgi:hypothetical protein
MAKPIGASPRDDYLTPVIGMLHRVGVQHGQNVQIRLFESGHTLQSRGQHSRFVCAGSTCIHRQCGVGKLLGYSSTSVRISR